MAWLSATLPVQKTPSCGFLCRSQPPVGALASAIFFDTRHYSSKSKYTVLHDHRHPYRIYSYRYLFVDKKHSALYAFSQLAEYNCNGHTDRYGKCRIFAYLYSSRYGIPVTLRFSQENHFATICSLQGFLIR